MKKHLSLLLFLFFKIWLIQGQSLPTWATKNTKTPNVSLQKLAIKVVVHQNIATTTLDMTFKNHTSQTLETALDFPLTKGVSVSGFALEVNGDLREAVVVDKQKATQVFETITRKNVDPGLLEKTKGNNFRARVYPILGHKTKKARVVFTQILEQKNGGYLYQMPIAMAYPIADFSVISEVFLQKPIADPMESSKNITLNFQKKEHLYRSVYTAKNKILDTKIAFFIAKPNTEKTVITSKGVKTKDTYFYLQTGVKPETRSKKKPKSITVVWDVSHSRASIDKTKELAFLQEYLQWATPRQIELITFSNSVHTKRKYTDPNALIKAIKNLAYDGATNIYSIAFNTIKSKEVLLFSDGISNFAPEKALQFHSPVVAIYANAVADPDFLSHIAKSSGGSIVNLHAKTIQEAIAQSTKEQKQFIKAIYQGNQLQEVYPKKTQPITDSFYCAGTLHAPKANITLYFGFGTTVTESKTISFSKNNTALIPSIETIWAQKKLQYLIGETKQDSIKTHAKTHGLVTKNTSLLVLDTVEDYLRYNITPPKVLEQAYSQLLQEREKNKAQKKQNKLEALCSSYTQDYHWWKKQTPYTPEKNNNASTLKKSRREQATDNRSMAVPPAPDTIEIVEDQMEVEEEVVISSTQADTSAADTQDSEIPEIKTAEKQTKASMQITLWDSNTPYMEYIKNQPKDKKYAAYLIEKQKYLNSPSFYFDMATYFFQQKNTEIAIRVISNLAELALENTEFKRTLARKLLEYDQTNLAISLFKQVAELRNFEPHSYLDLGYALEQAGETQQALETFYTVVQTDWEQYENSRFKGIETIALHHINGLIAKSDKKLDLSFLPHCFLKKMPLDIRIVLDWNADNTDIDLWITDPLQEKCSYKNKNTKIGGKISFDVTQGYGPEEFRLKHAIAGTYDIIADFYGSSKQTALGAVSVRALVYTNFGKKNQKKQTLTLQLDPDKKGDFTIGTITIE